MVFLRVTSIWGWREILVGLRFHIGQEVRCFVALVHCCNKVDTYMKEILGRMGLKVVKELIWHEAVPSEGFGCNTWNEVSVIRMFWLLKVW